jgi:guanylate kinase
MARGAFLIIVGPSAVGKTTVVDRLLALVPSAVRLVTTTSRPPRPGEVDGRDYHFVSRDEFVAKRDNGEFLEWNEFCGYFYGSSKVVLDGLRASHLAVFAVLDVNGARAAKAAAPDSVTIFIRPDSMRELERRLVQRPDCDPTQLAKRINRAVEEMVLATAFDYVVTNRDGHLDEAVQEIKDIVKVHMPDPSAGF